MAKINIWKSIVKKDLFKISFRIDHFIIEKNDCKTVIAKITIGHLKMPETQFRKYYILNSDFKNLSSILIGLKEIDHKPYRAQEEFAELLVTQT